MVVLSSEHTGAMFWRRMSYLLKMWDLLKMFELSSEDVRAIPCLSYLLKTCTLSSENVWAILWRWLCYLLKIPELCSEDAWAIFWRCVSCSRSFRCVSYLLKICELSSEGVMKPWDLPSQDVWTIFLRMCEVSSEDIWGSLFLLKMYELMHEHCMHMSCLLTGCAIFFFWTYNMLATFWTLAEISPQLLNVFNYVFWKICKLHLLKICENYIS